MVNTPLIPNQMYNESYKNNHIAYQYKSSKSSNDHQQWSKISTSWTLTRKNSITSSSEDCLIHKFFGNNSELRFQIWSSKMNHFE